MTPTVRGLLAMTCSAVCFSATSTLIRLAPNIDPFKSSLFRFAIGLALLGTAAMTKRIRLEFNNTSWLLSRGLFGGMAVYIFFWSINAIGLSKGTALSYTYPVFAAIWGHFLLKERVTTRMWAFILVAFGGFLLTSCGRNENLSGIGLNECIALFGSMLSGLAIAIVRKLRETDSSYAIFFSQCVIGFWMMLIPANLIPTAIGISGGFILLGIGISAAMGQILMTYAYKALTVSRGAVISLLTPICNIFMGLAIFDEQISLLNGLGMLLMLLACTAIATGKGDN